MTVVFLLYNAERTVPMLVEALARQLGPDSNSQADWLEAVFVDDLSRDKTRDVLETCLAERGHPSHWRVLLHERNLGLAATLNEAFRLATTPFVLSCHCDCEFGGPDYVARMVELASSRPDVAAITGKPAIPSGKAMPLAERVNLVANLMDVLPAEATDDLMPVGFAEGRCDIFRIEALRRVGFYDTTLRTAGEDQVLAARFRQLGYEVYQAPRLVYNLSVSDEQDTLWKLARHQRLFGRAHPYILLRTKRASAGVAGKRSGGNRQSRLLLRVQQLGATAGCLLGIGAVAMGAFAWATAIALTVALGKWLLFRRHLAFVRFSRTEGLVFAAMQPVLDASYALGVCHGLALVLTSSPERPID